MKKLIGLLIITSVSLPASNLFSQQVAHSVNSVHRLPMDVAVQELRVNRIGNYLNVTFKIKNKFQHTIAQTKAVITINNTPVPFTISASTPQQGHADIYLKLNPGETISVTATAPIQRPWITGAQPISIQVNLTPFNFDGGVLQFSETSANLWDNSLNTSINLRPLETKDNHETH